MNKSICFIIAVCMILFTFSNALCKYYIVFICFVNVKYCERLCNSSCCFEKKIHYSICDFVFGRIAFKKLNVSSLYLGNFTLENL